MNRTHTCGELRKEHVDKDIVLIGWTQRFRDHGGKKFVDLRDRKGMTQVVFDPDVTKGFDALADLKREDLIEISGKVLARPEGMINPKMNTGEIEVLVKSFEVVSKCAPLPFEIDEEHFKGVNEEMRLKYRYLDLRRAEMHEALVARSRFYSSIREFLEKEDFIEVETPTLTKSTPEGARDMLVPSRKHKGTFYALPQSPQLFKQLLMVGGIEKYYQIARCYRDEDSRKDRQLEFTQLDMEMSFLSQEDLFELIENLFKHTFKKTFNVDVKTPFLRLTYDDAIDKYGSDKPDMRIQGMELKNISDIVVKSGFAVFANVVKGGGLVKGMNVKNGSQILSRKDIDKLIEYVQAEGGKGLAWIKVTENGLESSITKFFTEDELKAISERVDAKKDDLLLFIADGFEKTNSLLDSLRRHLADKLELIDKTKHEFAWIIDFPMFHWNAEENAIESEHNPFTMCYKKDIPILESIKNREDANNRKDELLKIKTVCYDLTLDGVEIASGARRIHIPHIQSKVFEIIGLTKEEVEEKFGWFVEAYNYSAPPHLGIAPGIDRILMLMLGRENIRDVMAFPKNKVGYCPLTDAPSRVDVHQLKELHLNVIGVTEDKVQVKFPEQKY